MKTLKGLLVGTSLLGATVLGGCFLNDSGRSSNEGEAKLSVIVGVRDVDNLSKAGLAKSAINPVTGIVLKKLVVTLTSSIGTDAVIRDTLIADVDSGFSSVSTDAQSVILDYGIKPLRNWTIQVKTLDKNDSVIHISSAAANNIKVGEQRNVQLNLVSKFVVYVAKFVLPDSLSSQDTAVHQKQKLYIKRFVMVVDGDTVRDTSATYFTAAPSFHLVEWNYVRADTAHDVALFVYADSLGGWDPNRPIFGDTIHITSTDTTYTPELPWTGPGSPSDPDYDPSNPGGARAGLEINIGAVGLVMIEPSTPGNSLPKRKK